MTPDLPEEETNPPSQPTKAPKRSTPRKRIGRVIADTRFPYPHGIKSGMVRWSPKGKKLAEEMKQYVESRLLPKLKARTAKNPTGILHRQIHIQLQDACIYLQSYLEGEIHGGFVEFPFARLYPVKGGYYNVAIRRLVDWSRAEDDPVTPFADLFYFQAPNASFWVKVAQRKTFEECIDILVKEPQF